MDLCKILEALEAVLEAEMMECNAKTSIDNLITFKVNCYMVFRC